MPATAANLAVFIGCTGTLHTGDLHIAVTVLDARRVWDRTDYLIRPVSGSGQQWVSAARVGDLRTPEPATR